MEIESEVPPHTQYIEGEMRDINEDAITQDHTMALEEDPVLIEYSSKHG
ncbi:unnamed protein product, partial [Sphacelaria rigidula]